MAESHASRGSPAGKASRETAHNVGPPHRLKLLVRVERFPHICQRATATPTTTTRARNVLGLDFQNTRWYSNRTQSHTNAKKHTHTSTRRPPRTGAKKVEPPKPSPISMAATSRLELKATTKIMPVTKDGRRGAWERAQRVGGATAVYRFILVGGVDDNVLQIYHRRDSASSKT